MALIFCDSFDHYSVPSDKWTIGGGNDNDLTGTVSRTGAGAGSLLGIDTSAYAMPVTVGPLYQGCAVTTDLLNGNPCTFLYNLQVLCGLRILTNGAVQIFSTISGFLSDQSAPNIVTTNTYNYFELSCVVSGNNVTALARVNGFPVLGPVTFNAGAPYTMTQVQPTGPGAGGIAWIDDFYLVDGTGQYNNGFLGPVRIYSGEPVSDLTPLQWTPSTGSAHWSLVNAVPPNDGATYVSSNVVGDIDQYLHATGSPPSSDLILAVQHNLDAALAEAGARKISSNIGGTPYGAGSALNTVYHIYTTPYDINPVTGRQWQLADFTTLPVGPEVTA